MRVLLAIWMFFSLLSGKVYSQKQYRNFRKTLPGLTCNDTLQETHAKLNIPALEEWVSKHPKQYGAYYDLGMEYLTMIYADSINKDMWTEKCFSANDKYVMLAPAKMKYRGHWNSAVTAASINKCEVALKQLKQAQLKYKGKKDNWESGTEEWIKKKCLATE